MTDYVAAYRDYLTNEKHASANTLSSYVRDISQFRNWLIERGSVDLRKVKKDVIGEYNIEKSYVVNNEKHHSQLIYAIKENKRSVVLNFENVDLNIFTPNKSFNIIPDSSFYREDYNVAGKYRLIGSSILLKHQGDDEFKSSVQVTLNKVAE